MNNTSDHCACGEREECDHSCMPDVIDGVCSHCGNPVIPAPAQQPANLPFGWEYQAQTNSVVCGGCAFRYGAEHSDSDGSWTCPNCGNGNGAAQPPAAPVETEDAIELVSQIIYQEASISHYGDESEVDNSDYVAREVLRALARKHHSPCSAANGDAVLVSGDAPQMDRVFIGKGEYVRADEATKTIMDLQRNLRHWREECGKLHARLTSTEPQSAPYTLSKKVYDVIADCENAALILQGRTYQVSVERLVETYERIAASLRSALSLSRPHRPGGAGADPNAPPGGYSHPTPSGADVSAPDRSPRE